MTGARYDLALEELNSFQKTWVVTGAGGFIGSHLVEELLAHGQNVVGVDNFSTGYEYNITQAKEAASYECGKSVDDRFDLRFGDINDFEFCSAAVTGADYILHQAALGSVTRSIENPLATNETNVSGFLNLLVASKNHNIERFIFAASSSTYGDSKKLPKREQEIGTPLSPYAVTKLVNELYAEVFANTYDMSAVGLRYFNVFGPRQDPNGSYAAVIPAWIDAIAAEESVYINGDGETSRDFCYVDNVVQANILAALCNKPISYEVFNVAVGGRTTLNDLYQIIRKEVALHNPNVQSLEPIYRDFRVGDVRHSQADISKISSFLGYEPTHDVGSGLKNTVAWFLEEIGDGRRRISER